MFLFNLFFIECKYTFLRKSLKHTFCSKIVQDFHLTPTIFKTLRFFFVFSLNYSIITLAFYALIFYSIYLSLLLLLPTCFSFTSNSFSFYPLAFSLPLFLSVFSLDFLYIYLFLILPTWFSFTSNSFCFYLFAFVPFLIFFFKADTYFHFLFLYSLIFLLSDL